MADALLPTWWPTCPACGQPVTIYSWTHDPAKPKVMTLRVKCHGKVATAEVPFLAALTGTVATFPDRK